MLRRFQNVPFISILLILAILLAACGGAGSQTAAPPGQGPTGAAASPETPVYSYGGSVDTSTPTPLADTASPTSLPNTGETQTGTGAAAGASSFASAIRDVAQKVRPAVVQVTNEQVQIGGFNQPFTVPAGVGSGVIYDNQGHILTNDHVIEGAQRLTVSLPDGRNFKARLVGRDPQTDLAVLQISGDKLPVASLGSSRRLQVGDWVVAIGNALALPGGPTVSHGVVSALGRSVQEPGSTNGQTAGPYLFDLIQTDAPINPGNSGGPLIDLNGNVVGINTLVAGQAEPGVQAQGIGFAIAIDTAKPIADQHVSTGHVIHPYLGLSYVPLNPSIAAQIGIQQTQGVVVADVSPGSPASQAGLQPYDVITAIDNTPLRSDSDLAQFVNQHKPGDVLSLSVIRNNQNMTAKLTLGTAPSG